MVGSINNRTCFSPYSRSVLYSENPSMKGRFQASRRFTYLGFLTTLAVLSWLTLADVHNDDEVTESALLSDRLKFRDLSSENIENSRKASQELEKQIVDSEDTYYDEQRRILGTTHFSENTYSRQPYVANGYIGSRIPNVGFGYALDTLNLWTPNSTVAGALDNGWPLRNQRFAGAFVADFYSLQAHLNSTNFPELDKKGYTTVITAIPQWTDLSFSLNDTFKFNPVDVHSDSITNYKQNLSMSEGIVTTEMDWHDLLHIETTIFAHRTIHPLGVVSMDITLNTSANLDGADYLDLQITDKLNYSTSRRAFLRNLGYETGSIYMTVEPDNVPYSSAVLYSSLEFPSQSLLNGTLYRINDNNSTVSQNQYVRITKDSPQINIKKYVGIVSSEFPRDDNSTNFELSKQIVEENIGHYDSLLASHIQGWSDLYNNTEVEIPSDSLLELAARSSIFHLLANTRSEDVSPERGLPLPVAGLSSDSYGGMVFWDADIWMMPSLLPFFPEIAKQIVNYRNVTHSQAVLNAQENDYLGAVYPWTSGRYANCTSTGPCIDYEYHINVDIAMSSFLLYLSGGAEADEDYLRYTTWPILRDAARFFTSYVKFNSTLGMYETKNMTDPDEFANFVDNGAFTNAGIKTLLKWATDVGTYLKYDVDSKWAEVSEHMFIPISQANITLEYTGMNASVEIKQADVVLMTYPLGFITDETILNNAIKDLYYYSERQSASGPAMTYPIFVAAASSLLNHGCSSQSYLYKSVLPYLRSPFAQFSEQSDDNFLTNGLTQPAFPFLTANGGFLQAIYFGLTGLRYSYKLDNSTGELVRFLKFDPVQMPLLPGGITLRGFRYMDQILDIVIDDAAATVYHKSGNSSVIIEISDRSIIYDQSNIFFENGSTLQFKKRDLPGTSYTLEPGSQLVFPLFKPNLNIDGNIAEGKQITNFTAGVSGDVVYSVIDGNNYTHWQPLDKYENAKLLIDLGPGNDEAVTHGMILWGQRPARNMSIYALLLSEQTELLLQNTSSTDQYEIQDIMSPSLNNEFKNDIDEDFEKFLTWKMLDINDFAQIASNLTILEGRFVPLLENLRITPSEPYYEQHEKNSEIDILPSNRTKFTINYQNVSAYGGANSSNDNSSSAFIPRYYLISVEGTYDDDDDDNGATINEIAFIAN